MNRELLERQSAEDAALLAKAREEGFPDIDGHFSSMEDFRKDLESWRSKACYADMERRRYSFYPGLEDYQKAVARFKKSYAGPLLPVEAFSQGAIEARAWNHEHPVGVLVAVAPEVPGEPDIRARTVLGPTGRRHSRRSAFTNGHNHLCVAFLAIDADPCVVELSRCTVLEDLRRMETPHGPVG